MKKTIWYCLLIWISLAPDVWSSSAIVLKYMFLFVDELLYGLGSLRLLLTLVRHLGYSWSPGSTLKEIGTLSALRLAQKASQMARCTALYTTSRPVRATKAMGRQHSSGGSSHWEPAIMMVQQWIHLHKTEQYHWSKHTFRGKIFSQILFLYIKNIMYLSFKI